MTKVGIILGSVRPGRNGAAVAQWVHDLAVKRGDADYELIDLKDAIDFLYAEWNNKAIGFVSYGIEFKPLDIHEGKMMFVLDQVLAWNDATRTLRQA